MLNIQSFYTPGLLFLVTIAFGYSVKVGGKPYNSLLFNIHKLIALAGVVLVVIRLVRSDYFATSTSPDLLLIILGGAGVLALFVTGAIMSIQEELNRIPQLIHQVSPVLIIVAAFLFYYLNQGI